MTIRAVIFVCLLSMSAACFGQDKVTAKIDLVPQATRGAWCADFTNVLAAARAEHRPALIVTAGTECSFCYRLNKAMNSTDFKTWQADRKIYMAHVNPGKPARKEAERIAEVQVN